MDGSTGILTENSAVEKALKVEENKEMDLFDLIDMDPSGAETEPHAADSETYPDVDNDLVGKDAETANVYQTDRVRITIDPSRDAKLTAFGKETLEDRYLLNDEKGSPQKLFARVACHYADDSEHAQRIYDYISNLWFMPATPVLSNGGTERGLPISCFLNEASDSLEGIVDLWNENVWLAARGGGIGS